MHVDAKPNLGRYLPMFHDSGVVLGRPVGRDMGTPNKHSCRVNISGMESYSRREYVNGRSFLKIGCVCCGFLLLLNRLKQPSISSKHSDKMQFSQRTW